MKKKLLAFLIIAIGCNIFIYFISPQLAVALTIVILLCACFFILLFVLNAAYKHTNHWKNRFFFKSKFISGQGYRSDLGRNYDIANLGSNPALYGFFYENIRGQNWSTGSQGLEMDFEILKLYHSFLREGGVVLIPIMPFTAVSQYIKTKKQYWNDDYYIKFASILDGSQVNNLPNANKLRRMLKYPLLYNPKLARYLLIDNDKDNSLVVAEQTRSKLEIEFDADRMIKSWLIEFDARAMSDFLSDKYSAYYKEGQKILDDIIDFCKERSYVPILITIPMAKELSNKFSDEFHRYMITEFVNGLKNKDVKLLDYMVSQDFNDDSLFMGSFYFNLNGRKFFTNQVLKDLAFIK